jgi:membrane associated rhomboid family serine protease
VSEADPGAERFELRDRAGGIVLGPDGFHHPRSARGRGQVFTPYAELTHLALSDRQLWIATRRTLSLLPRRLFVSRDDPERLAGALVRRIGQGPGGGAQLARMAALDALARHAAPPVATFTLAALCGLGFLLELVAPVATFTVGYFSPALVADGDTWRLVTANLLHGFALHLLLNLVGLLVMGRLLERLLGSVRTIGVMGVSALGSMLASGLVLEGPVVGVSGVVFGLAGAVLWLELRRPEEIPAWWRFPRALLRVVLVAFAADVALGFTLPFVAGAAHLGGFASGLLAAVLLTRPGSLGRFANAPARVLATLVVGITVLGIGRAGFEVLRAPDFPARHAARLAEMPEISPGDLNDHAWRIAIDPAATHAQMEAALRLAERAVAETRGEEPTILDTLAEVQFQLGRSDLAVEIIDEAIAREPDEPYYREQRRRFTGERPADDRPPDPSLRLTPRRSEPPIPPDEEGLTA